MALNVLVVDDSAVMRSVIIKTLKLSGIPLGEVYQASNGEEGLDAIDHNWIDLAMVDINMPVMNGAEMLDKLRENPETESLPVIVVSTEGSDARINFIRSRGAEYVHKPFSPELLRQTIQAVTGVSNEQSGDGAFQSSGLDF